MSATIDLALFAAFFDGAPTLTVPGRLFPVAVHYAAPEAPRGERRAWRDDSAGGEGGEGGEGAAGEAAAVGAEAAEAAGVLPHGRRMLPSRARELLSPKAYLTLLQRIDAQYAARTNPHLDPDPHANPNPHPIPDPNPQPIPNPTLTLTLSRYPAHERGDALIFVSGVEEIERLISALQPYAASTGRCYTYHT